ncbi:MAG: flagellar filament capping protein FliD [Alphaproteobacteria bacterium]|nr:flagellar filament capping protein FliD [Alphaproteobacteria bacterium]
MIEGLNLDNLTVDESGRVSFSGLSSGIDLQGTVDAIIPARRIPIDTLETRVASNESQIAALEDLQVTLETLRTSLSSLYGAVSFGSTNDIFSGKQVFASSARIDGAAPSAAGNLLGVTVGNDAAVGNHTVEVLQVAKAHKISSDNIASATASLGFGAGDEFTISSDRTKTNFESAIFSSGSDTIGSSGTLTFVDETGTTIGTVAYTSTDTLDDFASSISANVTGVTGTVESASGGFRLDLTSATEFRFSESGAGTALTDFELGVRKVGVSATTTLLDLRDLINQANTGSNATGINASVVTVSATESYLVMTAEDTGVTMSLGETTGTPMQTVGLLTAGSAIKNTLQTPQSAQVYADGILDQTNTIYETSFQTASTVQIGSAGTLTFTRDSDSGALGTVNYLATDSLSDLAASITANITDVTASVVTEGAGVRLEITATSGTSITETASGTAIEDLGINNKRRAIERSSNTIDDLFTGVTLSLFAAEAGTVISLDIEQDLSQVKNQIVTFVDSYNAVRQFINSHRLVDENTGTADEESGVLFSSTALSEVGRALSLIVGQGATGVDQNFTVLSQIGVDFVDRSASDPLLAENLEINETTLDAVLLSNPDDV